MGSSIYTESLWLNFERRASPQREYNNGISQKTFFPLKAK